MSKLGFIVLTDIYIRTFLNSAGKVSEAEFTSQSMRLCSWGPLGFSELARGKGGGGGLRSPLLESSYLVGGNVSWYSYYGKRYGNFLKN